MYLTGPLFFVSGPELAPRRYWTGKKKQGLRRLGCSLCYLFLFSFFKYLTHLLWSREKQLLNLFPLGMPKPPLFKTLNMRS